jgi:hypothetical protein
MGRLKLLVMPEPAKNTVEALRWLASFVPAMDSVTINHLMVV